MAANRKCEWHGADDPTQHELLVQWLYLRVSVAKSPPKVQERVLALKNLQIESNKLDLAHQKAKFELAQKYENKYKVLDEKRHQLISGQIYNNDEVKPEWPQALEAPVKLVKADKLNVTRMVKQMKLMPEYSPGVPGFWLGVMQTFDIIARTIMPEDEAALLRLKNIKVVVQSVECFVLEFYFDEDNEYFKNSKLTKKYCLSFSLNKTNQISYKGPEIAYSEGCLIDWLPKRNLTVRCIVKREFNYSTKSRREMVQVIPQKSFFDYFSMNGALGEHIPHRLKQLDNDMGMLFRTQLVPKAVRHYAGDLVYDEPNEENHSDFESNFSDN